MTPLRDSRDPRPLDDVQRPSPGPFLVIGGLLSFAIVALGLAAWLGGAVALW